MSTRFPNSTPIDVEFDTKKFPFRPLRYHGDTAGMLSSTLLSTVHQDSNQEELKNE
jgi:hypothetical protein